MPAFPRRGARLALALALAGGPLLAHAQQAGPGLTAAGAPVPEPLSWFDVYGTSARSDADNTNSTVGDDSEIGIGASAHVTFGVAPRPVRFFLEGSAQRNQFDSSNIDLDQYRLGPGLEFGLPGGRVTATSPRFYTLLEFVDWRLDAKSTGTVAGAGSATLLGAGAHVGVRKPFGGIAAFYVQGGYVRIDDRDSDAYLSGPEIKAGFDLVPTPDLARNARVFAEYRYTGTRLRGVGGATDFTLGDIRAGVRIGFGDYRAR